ncbi:hypothetical protein CPB86DRAFT_791583 [Serendipita vermifera]|nr:hypothetical protein CPB86DRAFT_791583 [Serendipita vermifera]
MDAYSYDIQAPLSLHASMESASALLTLQQAQQQQVGGTRGQQAYTATAARLDSSSSKVSMDSSFTYDLSMDWRPSQSFEYQPYPSPYPSPAPSYAARPQTATHSHNSSISNNTATSPTLSSTASSPHHGPSSHIHSQHSHSHSHSHSAPIDPSLQDSYVHGWSHPPPQQAQSPIIASSPHPSAATAQGVPSANPYATPPPSAKPASAMSRQELEQELARLKTRVNELEVIHHWLELKGMRLEADVQHHPRLSRAVPTQVHGHPHQPPHHHGGHHHHAQQGAVHTTPTSANGALASLPSVNPSVQSSGGANGESHPVPGGVAPSEEFAAQWRSRTDARIKRFCALNRAGNALCAWHDSRRERRAYPPRQAPPGYLNCGCTNEEGTYLFVLVDVPLVPLLRLYHCPFSIQSAYPFTASIIYLIIFFTDISFSFLLLRF